MIYFEDVCKTYSTGTEAVKHTTLHIEKGDFAFIVGPSGCGKSTLMKMILKEESPTSGEIYINGKPICVGRWGLFSKILDCCQIKMFMKMLRLQ